MAGPPRPAVPDVARRLGDHPALERHTEAVAVRREVGDRAGEGRALNALGVALFRLGRWAEALAAFERCLALCRDEGDRPGEGAAPVDLGRCHERRGRYVEALARHTEAYALCTRPARPPAGPTRCAGSGWRTAGSAGTPRRWSRCPGRWPSAPTSARPA